MAHHRTVPLAILVAILCVSLFASPAEYYSDDLLYERSDAVVLGTVVSATAIANDDDTVETDVRIRPAAILKGKVTETLVLRQLGGQVGDGRWTRLIGGPEYTVGEEVLVFAITRPDGTYVTAEIARGKYEIFADEEGRRFAIPASARTRNNDRIITEPERRPRELREFRDRLPRGEAELASAIKPQGALRRQGRAGLVIEPQWNTTTARWQTPSIGFQILGETRFHGGELGGRSEALQAMKTWTDDPHSNVSLYEGNTNGSYISLATPTYGGPCGWTACLDAGTPGSLACAWISGTSGSHFHDNTFFYNATQAQVDVRCSGTNPPAYFTRQFFLNILTHELGHTLGFVDADAGPSAKDACIGDESTSLMQGPGISRSTLDVDDRHGLRWMYGDGQRPCTDCISTSVPTANWKGEYFPNKTLSGSPRLVRNDGSASLNFNWGGNSPYHDEGAGGPNTCGIGFDGFSARWTRTINFLAGTYTLTATADDGVRLYVDGALVLDRWVDQGATTYSVPVTLTEGNHTIVMEY
jgi:hypothetical protein